MDWLVKKTIRRLLLASLGLVILSKSSLAIDFSFSGYLKYLYSNTKFPFSKTRFNDHLLHSRLNSKLYLTSNLTLTMETRWHTLYGQSIRNFPDLKDQMIHHYPLTDLGWKLINNKTTFSYLEVDRLNLDYMAEKWQLTVGRQRIPWGTSLVWNIIDLFNPLSILDFDYEEHPGSDAIRWQYFTGTLSRIELAYQPAKSPDKQTAAFMWATHSGEYDIYFLLGSQNKRKTLGLAWAGYIKDAGFRGEMRWSQPLYKSGYLPPPLPFLPSLTDKRKNDFQLVISGDYSFPNTFYMHTEILYNRNGLIKNAGLYQSQLQQLNMLSVARYSIFQEFAYDLHPLVRANVFALLNPDDHSWLLAPSVSWSVLTNVDLYLIGFYSKGNSNSEFGAIGKAFYLRFKYSF